MLLVLGICFWQVGFLLVRWIREPRCGPSSNRVSADSQPEFCFGWSEYPRFPGKKTCGQRACVTPGFSGKGRVSMPSTSPAVSSVRQKKRKGRPRRRRCSYPLVNVCDKNHGFFMKMRLVPSLRKLLILVVVAASAQAQSLVNFESHQTRPVCLSPDGTRLFVVNTPDGRLSVFDVSNPSNAVPVLIRSF